MGCGLSLFRKPAHNSIPESNLEAALKPSVFNNTTESVPVNTDQSIEEAADFGNDDVDDYEKELQQLNDDKGGVEDMTSPPPTLDESMSDHGSPPLPIAATVTLKTLESPRSVIFTSTSRPTSSGGLVSSPLREFTTGSPSNIVETNQLADEQPQAASPSEDYSSEPPAFDEVANEIQDAAVNVESTNEEPQENEETTGEEIVDLAAENDQLNSIMETTEDEVNNSDQNDEEAPIETSNEGVDEQEKEEELQLTDGDEIGTEGELLANEEIEDPADKVEEEASPTVDTEESEDINPTESREDEVREEPSPEEDQVADPTPEILDQEQETKDEVELNVETAGNEEEVPIEEESNPVDEITPEDEESAKEIEPEIAEESEMTENNEEPLAQDDNNVNNEENVEGDDNDNQQAIENEIQQEEIDGDVTVDTPKEEEIPNTEEDNAIASQLEDLGNPQVDEGGELEVTDSNIEAAEDEQLNVDADAPAEDLDQELPESNEEPAQEEIVLEDSEMPLIESEEITAVEDELQEKSDLETGEEPINDVQVENAEEQETLNDENLTDAAIITDEMTDQDGLVDETAAQKDDENPDELVNPTEVDQIVDEDATETELQPESDEGVENTVAQDTADQPAEDEPNLAEEQIPEEENTNNDPDANDAIEATNIENVAENVTEEAIDDLSNDIGTDEGAQGDIVAFEDSQQGSEAINEVINDTEIDDNVFETAEESQAPEQVDESTEPTAEDDGKPENEKETTATADQDFNQIFDDGEQEASNDDEEEIWRKLQKDIQLEEEEQLQLAATRIQSTFRGYRTRKELNQQLSRQQDVEEGADDQYVDDIIAVEDQQEIPPAEEEFDSVLEDGEELTEALAGITETVASVALFMADSPNDELSRPRRSADDYNEENDDESSIVAACPNEVNDVKEEPLSNGEEVNDVQLINTYVIQTGRGLEETQNIDETKIELPITDSQDNLEIETEEMKETEAKEDNGTEATDPELVFELYVESNETTNDGLLQSCWQDNLKDLSSDSFDPNVLNTYEYEIAATKIQAGYRGYRDRKLMKTNENQTNNSQNESAGDVGSEEVSTNNPLSSQDEENAAAIKIQAGYRGHRDRKRVKDLKDDKVVEHCTVNEESDLCSIDSQNAAATKIQAGFRGHRERQQLKRCRSLNDGNKPEEEPPLNSNEINESNLSNSESELERENAAATKIQAGFRGHRDRERVKVLQNTAAETENSKSSAGADECCQDSTDFVNDKTSDLTNNSTEEFLERENAAATKIQAGFRGHRDRERVKNLQNNIDNRKSTAENEGCEDSTDFVNNETTDPTNNLTDELLERENAAATKIQAGFRGHRDRERVKGIQSLQTKNPADCTEPKDSGKLNFDALSSIFDERHNAAAIKIQSGYRGYRERKNLKRSNSVGANYAGRYSILSSDDFGDFYPVRRDSLPHMQPSTEFTGIIRRRDSAPNFNFVDFENEEYDCDPDSEQEKAAIKIQSNFRGYRVRKERKIQQAESQIIINPTENCTESLPAEAQDDDAENQAAIKIQAGYRGYRTRKNIRPNNV